MDAIDTRELIDEVARRHGVLLDPGDPIFATVTLNERIVAGVVEQVAAMLEATTDQLSAAAAQQQEAARTTAAALITSSAAYIVDQAQKAGDELAVRLRDGLAAEIARAQGAARDAGRTEVTARWIGTTAVGALGLLLGVLLGVLIGWALAHWRL